MNKQSSARPKISLFFCTCCCYTETDLTLALRSGEEREKAFIVYIQKLEGRVEERGGERQKHCAEARDVPEHTVTRKCSIRIPPAKTRS